MTMPDGNSERVLEDEVPDACRVALTFEPSPQPGASLHKFA